MHVYLRRSRGALQARCRARCCCWAGEDFGGCRLVCRPNSCPPGLSKDTVGILLLCHRRRVSARELSRTSPLAVTHTTRIHGARGHTRVRVYRDTRHPTPLRRRVVCADYSEFIFMRTQ